VNGCWNCISETEQYPRIPEEEHNWNYYWTCDWLGYKADFDFLKQNNDAMRERLQNYATQLLNAAEPLWKTQGPVAFQELGQLAQPMIPQYLKARESVYGRNGFETWLGMRNIRADLDQVRPFFSDANQYIALAAIDCVRSRMSSTDQSIALARMNTMSFSHADSWGIERIGVIKDAFQGYNR
jgi:hypothetical protein